jgi:hypothetical protein
VDGLKSAKEVWDTLFINHEGTKQVREGRIRALESELNRFVIKDDESPQDMYNRLNKIINKIKSLGSTRWGRREVVDKILSTYMARDVQLPTLIREKRGFNKFTPADVIERMEEHLITVKESKLSQEMSKMHEQLEKNKGVALKASSKEKRSSSSTSKTVVEEDSDEDSDMNMTPEQMALFVRKFNKMFKKSGFFNKNKDKDKIKTKRTSKRPCFGCGKEGHFIAECPNVKVRRRDTNKFDKNKKKEIGEAHLGEEWDSNDDGSDSDGEAGLATTSIGEPINKSSLFEDLTDDEDDFTHTCLMARGSKAYSSGGTKWVIDSGCTNHMTGEKKMFTSCDMVENPMERIAFGGNGGGIVVGLGKIAISINHSISDVYLVESLDYNLLSVSQLCEMGYNCLFTNEGVTVFRRGDDSVAFKGELKGRLYLVDFSSDKAQLDTCLLAKSSLSWLWHR